MGIQRRSGGSNPPLSLDATPSQFYNGTTLVNELTYLVGIATVSEGEAVINLTKDGTPDGLPVFSTIFTVFPAGEYNTDKSEESIYASIKSISGDMKVLRLNVVSGEAITSPFGSGLKKAPNGSKVHVTVMGVGT